ncbi:hypothetical protein E3N88_02919 [Mikania micrantha]|uniref:Uncharacterized protein n=1 Tax=Mikania micrantha TaxID=192012 RepID=A0A5N6Q5I5_9ASTR|nr:hypothetical protein E3N88_02919 [Mikania micrantha]
MSTIAQQNLSQTSFLDQTENGVLHSVKYQGLGYDFIMVNNLDSIKPKVVPEQAFRLCGRNFGIGADGVIIGSLSFTVHTGAGLIIPEVQLDEKWVPLESPGGASLLWGVCYMPVVYLLWLFLYSFLFPYKGLSSIVDLDHLTHFLSSPVQVMSRSIYLGRDTPSRGLYPAVPSA